MVGVERIGLLDEVCKKIFGDKYKEIKEWCIKREKAEKFNAIPKGRVANVFVVIEPLSRLIIRQEAETTDVTTIPSRLGYNLPAILNPKFQSGAIRRQMLSMLHEWFDRTGKQNYLSELKNAGYSDDDYTCVMRPYMRQVREAQVPEGFEGYCRECPNCLIFGYAVQEGAGYNVKARVEGDLYVAPVPAEKAIVTVTFNAVDDIAKTTYRPEAPEELRTGALYEFAMIEAGTPFVGKLAIKDVTCAELLLTLIALARTTRIGGRTTHFGQIKIYIPAILFSTFESGSGYELANLILSKNGASTPPIENVVTEVVEYVKKFEKQGILVTDRALGDKLRSLAQNEVDSIILQAWKDVLIFKKSLDIFVGKDKKEDKRRGS